MTRVEPETRDHCRRRMLKLGLAAVPAVLAGPAAATSGAADTELKALQRVGTQGGRLLIKGGTVVTMDKAVADLVRGDLLIEGGKIAAVGPDLSCLAAGALEISAEGRIVMPGFCDPHIHAWQGQLSHLIPNQVSAPPDDRRNYTTVMHQRFAPAYRPEDMYIGTLMTLLTCLNAGITTVGDNSHNARSAEHTDAAVQAMVDAGGRGFHASGAPRFGDWRHQWPQDLNRVKSRYFSSDDQLLAMRIFAIGASASDFNAQQPEVLKIRKDLNVWFSLDGGAGIPANLPELYSSGAYDGRETYNHGVGFPVVNMRTIVDHGAKVDVCPRIETQFGAGSAARGIPFYQDWLDFGLRPALSNDDPATYAIDMFAEMHVMYAVHRAMAQNARFNKSLKTFTEATVRELLESATLRGAECCALDHRVGSLTPGKDADIILIDARALHLFPPNNAIATIVQGAGIGDVEAVFVAGKVRKWRGSLTAGLWGTDLEAVKARALKSRDYLFDAVGWRQDPFAD